GSLPIPQLHAITEAEPPRTALGRSNPKPNGWAARCSPHILDPYGRGACDVCPGLPSLKVVGTDSVRFTNSPITKAHGVKSKRGRTAIDFRGDARCPEARGMWRPAYCGVARQKVQGQPLNWFIVEQHPAIPPDAYTRRFGNKSAAEIVRAAVLELTY